MKSENEFINFVNVLFNSSLSVRILFESLEMISNALDTHLFRCKPEQDKAGTRQRNGNLIIA